MCDVCAPNVEEPREIVRVADKEAVGTLQRRARTCDLGDGAFACMAASVQSDLSERRLRAVAPDGVDRICRKCEKLSSRALARGGKPRDSIGSVKVWIVSELVPRPQVSADPLARRIVNDITQFEHGAIRLRLGLLGIPAIDEERRFVLKDDRNSGRSRETRQPQEALGARGHILILMLVCAWGDKPGDASLFEFHTQLGYARSGVRWAANVSKRLKPALEHEDVLWRPEIRRRLGRSLRDR